MKSSYQFFRAFGIDVKIHFTFFFFLIWIVLATALDANGGVVPALYSALFVCLAFAFVLLHEFGHSLAALHYGVQVQDIILTPVGGMARLAYIPRRPWHEFVITIAGPAVNLLLAAIFFALALPASMFDLLGGFTFSSSDFLAQLLLINLFLLVFNLIPAFPMDGGRILRSLLAMKMSYLRATRIAARIGQLLCAAFFIYGLFWGPITLCLVGVVIFFGATAELFAVELAHAYGGATAYEYATGGGASPASSSGPLAAAPSIPHSPSAPGELPARDLRYRYEELLAKGEKVTPVYSQGKIIAVIRNVSP